MPLPVGVRLHLERALAHHRALLDQARARTEGERRARGSSAFGAILDHTRAHRSEGARATGPSDALARAPASTRREEVHEVVVRPGDTLWSLAVHRLHVPVEDLARQSGIDPSTPLRPGQRLRVHRMVDSMPRRVVASWYGPGFDGRPMANGAPYDRHAATIAHRTLPLGTEVELRNPRTGTTVRARVEDRGPYVEGRDVDLSWGLARVLGLLEAGVGELEMRVLG